MSATIELIDLPPELSLSAFLSPADGDDNFIFDKDETVLMASGKQLDSSRLIALALNEECGNIGRGAFYHLPLRSKGHEAHPCDLIYLPETWSTLDTALWDQSTWVDRLELCKTSQCHSISSSHDY